MPSKRKPLPSGMLHVKNTNKFDAAAFQHMKSFGLLKAERFTYPAKSDLWKFYARATPALADCFQEQEHGVAITRYIILVYDKQSPFRATHNVLIDRKKAVAAFVELKGEAAIMAMELSQDFVVDAVSDYLKFQDDRLWSLIIQNEEVFISNQRQVIAGISLTNKDTDRYRASELSTKLLTLNRQIHNDLKSLYAEFTGNDTEAAFKISKRKSLTPEVIAAEADSGFNPLQFSPFYKEEEE